MIIENMQATNFELNICHSEGMLHITFGNRVLLWAQEKIECHPDAVDGGSISVEISTQLGSTKQDKHGNWFDSCGRVVFFLPGYHHATKVKILVSGLV